MPPKSTAVVPAAPTVPDLVQPREALDIGQADVALPRIKIGQPQAAAVQEGTVPAYSLYAATGSEDPEPVILHELDSGDEGVLVHVLAMRKGKSLTEDGELQTWAFDDPAAPPEAWVTYNYVLALPEHDPDVPYKMLFTRTASPAAKQINTVLQRNAGKGPSFMTAFRITTQKREKQQGSSTYRWGVPRVRSVEADQEGVDISAALYRQISDSLGAVATTAPRGDEPAI
jgi:hypothetical protein